MGQNGGCATGAQQILIQHMARCHARSVDKVGCNSKVKAMRCVETCVPRLTHHCHIFEMNGESYRFKQSVGKNKNKKK